MINTTQKRGIGQRINAWLDEPEGETFRHGKWRFWFLALTGFSLLNAVLTALVFDAGGILQTYMGSVLVGVGAMLAWLGVGALHYSDSYDSRLARGVSALDSITLLFVVAHFCFLLWVYGHTTTLKTAEVEYKTEIEKYNAQARQVQADNAKIADALRSVAEAEAKRARIENDTVYQARKAAQAGAKVQTGRSQSLAGNISVSPVELAKPPAPPKQSSADYLTEWDAWIRLANFGELGLAIFTLIFIRNRTAKTNARSTRVYSDDDFPDEIDTETRSSSPRERLEVPAGNPTTHVSSKNEPFSPTERNDTVSLIDPVAGRKKLLDALKLIAFHHPGIGHFKADTKMEDDCVWIRLMTSDHGIQRTKHSAQVGLAILNDALTMNDEAFRARLETYLRKRSFPLS